MLVSSGLISYLLPTKVPGQRRYRLIDSGCEPHRQLDGQYGSLDEAIAEAIAWLEPLAEPDNAAHLIGVDVATADGNWRTCRLPAALLCPLLCELPS